MAEGPGQATEGRLQQPWSDAADGEKPLGQHGQEGQGEKRKNWRRRGVPHRQDFIQRNIQVCGTSHAPVTLITVVCLYSMS